MASAPINVAVIGYGMSARTFHIPFIQSLPDLFHLHTIQQRPNSKAGPPASEPHPNVRIAPSFEAVFEGSGALPPRSLVIITTANSTHNEFALAAMKAGHHVVVEKPAALNVADAEALLEASQKHGLVCSAYQNRRLDSDFLTLRGLLASPRNDPTQPSPIGQPTLMESRFDRYRPFPKGGWREEVKPEQGGGMLWDLGAHLIDQGEGESETLRSERLLD
jgi:predicted dehydrogenase